MLALGGVGVQGLGFRVEDRLEVFIGKVDLPLGNVNPLWERLLLVSGFGLRVLGATQTRDVAQRDR